MSKREREKEREREREREREKGRIKLPVGVSEVSLKEVLVCEVCEGEEGWGE